jgi:G protein-coupled receptor 158
MAISMINMMLLASLLSIGLCAEILDSGSGDGDGEEFQNGELSGDTDSVYSDQDSESISDIVDKFLIVVEQYERNKDNCTPGVTFNLGEGVVAQYGIQRFHDQAMVAVNRANFLTRLWIGLPGGILDSDYFFYTAVRSMVESDPDLFAAGNCYDKLEYKNYTLFCPYAMRMPDSPQEIMVKDLSVEYKYLGNDSEFFIMPRKKANSKLLGVYSLSTGTYILHCNRRW